MAFEVLEMSLIVLERLGPIEKKVRQKRKSLADEMGRAGESIPLNLSEGHKRAGLDRADLFRRAEGSSGELTTCLRIALLRELIRQGERLGRHAARPSPGDAMEAHPLNQPGSRSL